jgi:flavin-dependent dehydrogenase
MMDADSRRTQAEALIIGGGPAGAALGTLLARRGRNVEIVEQSPAMHHKVCGEFLSREAVSYVAQLGLDLGALGAAPIRGVRLASHRSIVECELPFAAMSMTRRKLDEALLALAAREGAAVRRGRRVEALQRSGSGWSAQLTGGEIRGAQSVFLATGKHDLAGHRRPPGKQNDLIAFKMYFDLAAAQQQALRGWVELILFPGGYAGLQLTEDGDANLCLLVNRTTLQSCRNEWQTLLERTRNFSEHLALRLDEATPLLPKPLALSAIPYGMLLSDSEPGLWRLGDQAAVTASFSGDGISIAFHSAKVAADLYMNGGTAAQLAQRLQRELSGSIHLATIVSRLMIAAPGLAHLARAWPPLVRILADHTRVPQSALVT